MESKGNYQKHFNGNMDYNNFSIAFTLDVHHRRKVALHITVPQIADGGDLETQMFGLTTKFNKMQIVSIQAEKPAIGNVLLAAGDFISSNVQKPPFQKIVETYTPFGYANKAMFHENENDGYDFKNEKPMVAHFIDDFETEVLWRLPDSFACH